MAPLLSWLLLSALPVAVSAWNPAVKKHQTTYVGTEDSANGVEIWRGIRYAQPPVGSLRLQPPEEVDNDGTIDATNFGAECFQQELLPFAAGPPLNITESEDCLFLNIYRPSRASVKNYADSRWHSEGLPVMVWLYGGGFNDGSGDNYVGTSLVNTSVEVKSPVIVVTLNYRLSFFGFPAGKLAAEKGALNLGLLDQREALKWISRNIGAWGGDPEKVTIFGQSAGASSVGLQMTAYGGHKESLFRAAILESGSPQDTTPIPPPTFPFYQLAFDQVVASVSCTNSSDVFACIQAVPEQVLFKAVSVVGKTIAPLAASTYPWQPVVDGTFVPDFPSKLLEAGKFKKIPTITGFTTDEITYVIPITLNISSDLSIFGLANLLIPYVPQATVAELLALDPVTAFFQDPAAVGGTEWYRATALVSDITKRCPGIAFTRNVTEYAPSWKYRFNAITPAQLQAFPYQRIVHAAELSYVWGPSTTALVNPPEDLALSRIVQKAWISFASHLDPNALGELSPGVSWPNWELDIEQVLVFQKPDGSGDGSPIGQGLHTEKDGDDRAACNFIIAKDADFIR